MVPYFIFATIGAVVHLAWRYTGFLNKDMFFSLLVTSMPDPLYIGAGWFLIASFWGNIYLYLWIRFVECNSNISKYAKLIIVSIIMYLAIHVLEVSVVIIPEYNRVPWRMDSGVMAFVFMLIGRHIKKYHIIENFKCVFYVIIALIIFISVGKTNGWSNIANCSYNNGVFYYVAAISGTFLILVCSYYLEGISVMAKFVGLIGRLSLPMFMLHGMFLSFMNTHMSIETGTIPLNNAWWYAAVLVFVVLPFAWIWLSVYHFSIAYQKNDKI